MLGVHDSMHVMEIGGCIYIYMYVCSPPTPLNIWGRREGRREGARQREGESGREREKCKEGVGTRRLVFGLGRRWKQGPSGSPAANGDSPCSLGVSFEKVPY